MVMVMRITLMMIDHFKGNAHSECPMEVGHS